ncbi:MAG: hypothetical protein IT170_18140 [Bryobacterales bacterium]|nr:hypothetical protein [Bryobacterales bacterium]
MRCLIVLLLFCAFTSRALQAEVKIEGVVNSASFEPGLPAGGSLATVFVSGFSEFELKPGTYIAEGTILPFSLAGREIIVNGASAPILAVIVSRLGLQINFQVPLERNASLAGALGASAGALAVAGVVLTPLPRLSPVGDFFADANGFAIARHASDNSPVSLDNPARPGETIHAYANDFFAVWPPPPIGSAVPEQPQFLRLPIGQSIIRDSGDLYLQEYPKLNLKGQSFTNTPALDIKFAGLAPGKIGVELITFVVPANQQPGDWALFFNLGSCPDGRGAACYVFGRSSPYVKIPVR